MNFKKVYRNYFVTGNKCPDNCIRIKFQFYGLPFILKYQIIEAYVSLAVLFPG